jgi:hypothetical protein
VVDFRAEQRFDGALDLGLVRIGCHFKHDRSPILLALNGCLLGDERPSYHVCQFHKGSQRSGFQLSEVL